ncbi:hypothetical protein AB0L88_09585 [Saccharopolyspora shandongensis]|uniref:hypothetical protein n=1 Tax=Saccharopolyspora shandongensis TaxID=418495 RepID=UPI003411FE2B
MPGTRVAGLGWRALLGVVERSAGAVVALGDGVCAADGVDRAAGEPGEARPVDQGAAVAVADDRRAAVHGFELRWGLVASRSATAHGSVWLAPSWISVPGDMQKALAAYRASWRGGFEC